jgi:hypothetical protein
LCPTLLSLKSELKATLTFKERSDLVHISNYFVDDEGVSEELISNNGYQNQISSSALQGLIVPAGEQEAYDSRV